MLVGTCTETSNLPNWQPPTNVCHRLRTGAHFRDQGHVMTSWILTYFTRICSSTLLQCLHSKLTQRNRGCEAPMASCPQVWLKPHQTSEYEANAFLCLESYHPARFETPAQIVVPYTQGSKATTGLHCVAAQCSTQESLEMALDKISLCFTWSE